MGVLTHLMNSAATIFGKKDEKDEIQPWAKKAQAYTDAHPENRGTANFKVNEPSKDGYPLDAYVKYEESAETEVMPPEMLELVLKGSTGTHHPRSAFYQALKPSREPPPSTSSERQRRDTTASPEEIKVSEYKVKML